MLKKFENWIFPSIIVSVGIVLVLRNYSPGTYLTGWDNLHPEFNIGLNIKRSLFAVWQEYQGVGLLGGMAHAADLPRQIVLWVLSSIVPTQLLRYLWTFLMLILGPLGVFFLLRKVFDKGKDSSFVINISAFVASIFYLFNLSTIQTFFTPFETFVSFYGFLPWLLRYVLGYLHSGKRKELLMYFVVSLLAISAFYVQTLFIVYLVLLLVFMFESVFWLKKTGVSRCIKLTIVTFCINAFWLFPVLYFSLTSMTIPGNSKINSIATIETQLMNQARGTFADIASLKGYWFDYYDFGTYGKYDYLYKDWIDYTQKPYVVQTSLILFFTSLVGFLYVLFKREFKIKISGPLIFFISYFMLATTNPPFGKIYEYFSDKIPLFVEMFRNSYTKWSIPASLIYSLGIGFFVYLVGSVLKEKLKCLVVFLALTVVLISVYTVKPVFDGKLVSERVRTVIPDEYFQAFDYFNSKSDKGRIAYLPFYNFWGWEFYKWGYGGSGFLWYGIGNPILDRAFDVWSSYNESFYNEASFVLYKYKIDNSLSINTSNLQTKDYRLLTTEEENARTITEFEKILEKYQVKYLLLDESIINAGGSEKLLYTPQIKELIANSNNIKEAAKFGFLTVYKVVGNESNIDYVSAPKSYISVKADTTYSKYDYIYQKYGNYITPLRQDYAGQADGLQTTDYRKNAVGIPFANFDNRSDVNISVKEDQLIIENKEQNARVELPIKDSIIEGFNENQGYKGGYNCDLKKKGEVEKRRFEDPERNRGIKDPEQSRGAFYGAYNGGVSCDWFYYPQVKYDQAYVLHIAGKNIEGRSLKIYLQNIKTGKFDLEELLPTGKYDSYFVIYPTENSEKQIVQSAKMKPENSGYTLNVETRSFGRIASENVIQDIEIIPFDIDFLTSLTTSGEEPKKTGNDVEIKSIRKIGTVFYSLRVQSKSKENIKLVALGQGYENGWMAYSMPNAKCQILNGVLCKTFPWFFGVKLQHVKVNGWENGWLLSQPTDYRLQTTDYSRNNSVDSSQSTIVIFYWTQLLEWGGLILVVPILLFIVRANHHKLTSS